MSENPVNFYIHKQNNNNKKKGEKKKKPTSQIKFRIILSWFNQVIEY